MLWPRTKSFVSQTGNYMGMSGSYDLHISGKEPLPKPMPQRRRRCGRAYSSAATVRNLSPSHGYPSGTLPPDVHLNPTLFLAFETSRRLPGQSRCLLLYFVRFVNTLLATYTLLPDCPYICQEKNLKSWHVGMGDVEYNDNRPTE